MSTIFVCFFGITRSLTFTIGSIRQNVLAPARALGEVRVLAHLFEQDMAISGTGRSEGRFGLDEPAMLGADRLEQEKPEACLDLYDYEAIKAPGDGFNNGFRSLRNLIHQLHSLRRVTSAALEEGAEIVVFCRPDLRYHDSLGPAIEAAMRAKEQVFVPGWQSWDGYNDRFAIAVGPAAIAAYGKRIDVVLRFLAERRQPLHSESLVRFALETSGIGVTKIPQRASRVRASGGQVWESFKDGRAAIAHEQLKAYLWRTLELSGAKPLARIGFRTWQKVNKQVHRRRLRSE